MYTSFEELELTRKLDGVEGNVFIDMMNNLLRTGTGSSVINIIKGTPKFNVRRLELDDMENILIKITKTVVAKMFHTDFGELSLRNLLLKYHNTSIVDVNTTNNIAYGVIASTSKYLLASLRYYFSDEFIFFYIRDSIVEPNYRSMVKELDATYNTPREDEKIVNKTRDLARDLNAVLHDMVIDIRQDSNINNKMVKSITGLVEQIKELPESTLDNVIKYDAILPVPDVLIKMLNGEITEITENRINNFISNIKLSHTKERIISVYKEFGDIKMTEEVYRKIDKLIEKRFSDNTYSFLIDDLNYLELGVLHKILTFQNIGVDDLKIIKADTTNILSNIRNAVQNYGSVGVSFKVNNDNIEIKSKDSIDIFHFRSETMIIDRDNAFNVFGRDAKYMENKYKVSPHLFCSNQAVINSSDRKELVMSGRTKMFRDTKAAVNFRSTRIRQLLTHPNIKRDSDLLRDVERLRNGLFDKPKYVRVDWEEPVVIDDQRLALLTMAEMEGISKKIKDALEINKSKQQNN